MKGPVSATGIVMSIIIDPEYARVQIISCWPVSVCVCCKYDVCVCVCMCVCACVCDVCFSWKCIGYSVISNVT